MPNKNFEQVAKYYGLYWLRPCEKTGQKNQWFKPAVTENKSLVRKERGMLKNEALSAHISATFLFAIGKKSFQDPYPMYFSALS